MGLITEQREPVRENDHISSLHAANEYQVKYVSSSGFYGSELNRSKFLMN